MLLQGYMKKAPDGDCHGGNITAEDNVELEYDNGS